MTQRRFVPRPDWGALTCTGLLLFAAPSYAQEQVGLDYRSPPSCPDRAEFEQERMRAALQAQGRRP